MSNSGDRLIEIRALTKRFGSGAGSILAVAGVSFDVSRGEVLGFLGPNGAGKSTTMKMVTGFLGPTSGTALVGGHDVTADPIAVKSRLGYLPEGAPAYPDMTPESFLGFCAEVRGYRGSERRDRIERAISQVQLGGVRRQSIDTLSKGFKRRVGLAQAILHDPEVLILDEPTDGLDPNQKQEVRSLIASMAKGKAIVLSTHILEEVEAVCTRAIIIDRGRVVADGTPAALQARSRYHNAVTLALRVPAGTRPADDLAKVAGVATVEPGASSNGVVRVTVLPKAGKSIADEVGALVRSRGWGIDEMRVEAGRLDEVFRAITGAVRS